MNVQRRMVTEMQYREGDLMGVVRGLIAQRITGQIVLDLSQGVVCAVTSRLRTVVEVSNGNNGEKVVDNGGGSCATLAP